MLTVSPSAVTSAPKALRQLTVAFTSPLKSIPDKTHFCPDNAAPKRNLCAILFEGGALMAPERREGVKTAFISYVLCKKIYGFEIAVRAVTRNRLFAGKAHVAYLTEILALLYL